MGIGLLIIVGILSFQNIKLLSGEIQMGRVSSYSSDGQYPIIEFETKSGEIHTVQSLVSRTTKNGENLVEIGTPMKVIYLSNTPEEAKIYTFFGVWGEAIALAILGLLFVGNFWWWWRKQRK